VHFRDVFVGNFLIAFYVKSLLQLQQALRQLGLRQRSQIGGISLLLRYFGSVLQFRRKEEFFLEYELHRAGFLNLGQTLPIRDFQNRSGVRP